MGRSISSLRTSRKLLHPSVTKMMKHSIANYCGSTQCSALGHNWADQRTGKAGLKLISAHLLQGCPAKNAAEKAICKFRSALIFAHSATIFSFGFEAIDLF
ncbi:hypothetical protein GPALN_005213 [Globodera pallida]|nr:hypothetical protein GPALN_005213 [Globodera pallida]